jgi:ornithine carrier protein
VNTNRLLKGIASPILGAAAENSSLFFSYNMSKDVVKNIFLSNQKEDLSLRWLVFCGGVSGLITSFILTPIELIKCKIQVEHVYSDKSSSILKLCKEILAKDGLKGFWFGQTGTLLREGGGSASWFGVYELTSHLFKELRLGSKATSKDENTIPELLISGASAGIMYNLSLYPADTIKSKMQTNSVINPNEKTDFISAAKTIYKYNGLRGFYRGLSITLVRAIPSNAVIFFTYEKLKQFYG